MAEKITRERAHELVEQCDVGVLVVTDIDLVPVIGEIDPDEREIATDTQTFEFGELPDYVKDGDK